MPHRVLQLVPAKPDEAVLFTLNRLVQMANTTELVGIAGAVIWKGGRWEYFVKGLAERRPDIIFPPLHALIEDVATRITHRR